MINLERKIGPLRVRAWGLVVNMIANATALFGLSRVLNGGSNTGSGWLLLTVGAAVTLACIAVCSRPAGKAE